MLNFKFDEYNYSRETKCDHKKDKDLCVFIEKYIDHTKKGKCHVKNIKI